MPKKTTTEAPKKTVRTKNSTEKVKTTVTPSAIPDSERDIEVKPTGDTSLDEVLSEPGAGASDSEIDVESEIGEQMTGGEEETPKIKEEAGETKDQTANAISVPEIKASHRKAGSQMRKKPLHSKRYRNVVQDIDLTTPYSKEEALTLVKKTAYAKFDGTVEVHIALTIQNQRGTITLPSGSGKERRILVANAESIDDVLGQIESGKFDFDILLATPDVMPKLSKVAKILGPKGLMPNPKSGTVTADIEKARAEYGAGRVEYKQDKGGVVHLGIGKVSMSEEQLLANLNVLLGALPAAKIKAISLSSTMGPGIKVRI